MLINYIQSTITSFTYLDPTAPKQSFVAKYENVNIERPGGRGFMTVFIAHRGRSR